MCGRYQFTAEQCEEIRQIAEAIQRKYGAGAWTPGEIRPSNHAPVLLDGAGGPVPKLMKWGYQLPGMLLINARAETAAESGLGCRYIRSRVQGMLDEQMFDNPDASTYSLSFSNREKTEPTDCIQG